SESIEYLWKIAQHQNVHAWMIASEKLFRGNRPDRFRDYTWLKMGFSNIEEEQKAEIIEQINQFGSFDITNSHPRNLEINQLGVHKAKALQSLCDKEGIQMNKPAGIGVAMKNAQDTLLIVADAVTESNENDGVPKAVERFLWNK